jgi:cytochrome c biogenesis protein CcdA
VGVLFLFVGVLFLFVFLFFFFSFSLVSFFSFFLLFSLFVYFLLPFALPYFAAIDQILKANFATGDTLVLLVAYNLVYALPFLVVPILVATLGERSRPILQRVNATLDRASAFLMPVLLGLAGLALVADAVLYFTTGKGLF